ncbi:hypothetical protein B0H13DRAFT_2369774 [Mycena leptocephala]|nr:hypothetical protein B0H13DRAFT_2369774 [Mycena leptocephala]
MGRGRKTLLSAEKLAYLESYFPEFQELQPNLGRFWTKVERGWNEKWPVELDLGLPILSTQGVLLEDTGVPVEHQVAVGEAQEKNKATIHNWFNNRSQKEKKLLNASGSSGGGTFGLKELMANFGVGVKRTRKLHRVELWQKRNPEVLEAALRATEYHELMGSSDEEETPDKRSARIKTGWSAMLRLQRRVRAEQFEMASEAEKAAVEEEYAQQECKKTGLTMGKAETPEEFQEGLEKLGPLLKTFHGALGELTGWVGGTVMTGPIPNQGGKIGTQSYCHGVTPVGHTLDQAIAGWDDNVVAPLQQFGKKITPLDEHARFKYPNQRSRWIQAPPASLATRTTECARPRKSPRNASARKKSKTKSKKAAEPSAYADDEGAAIPSAAAFFTEALGGRSSADYEGGAGNDWWTDDNWRAENSISANHLIDPALGMALYASPPVDPAAVGLYTCPTVDPAADTSLYLSPPLTRPKPRPAHHGSLFGRPTDDPTEPFELTSLSEDSAATHNNLSAFVSNFVYPPPTPSAESSPGGSAPRSPVLTPLTSVSASPGAQATLSTPARLSIPTPPATALSTHGSPGPGGPASHSPAAAHSTPAPASRTAAAPTPQPHARNTAVLRTPGVGSRLPSSMPTPAPGPGSLAPRSPGAAPSTPARAPGAAAALTPQPHARGTPVLQTPGVGSRPSSSVTTPSPLRVMYTAPAAPKGPVTSPLHPA